LQFFINYYCDCRSFSDINVPQGVATHIGCSGIFNKYFAANLLDNLTVKNHENPLRINRLAAMSLVSPFFETQCSCTTAGGQLNIALAKSFILQLGFQLTQIARHSGHRAVFFSQYLYGLAVT